MELTLSGDCTIGEIDAITKQITNVLSPDESLVLSLSLVERTDAAFWQLVLSVRQYLLDQGQQLKLQGVTEAHLRALRSTSVNNLFA